MLVLTRKLDESIIIGDDITITILKVKGNAIRIGIEAPRDVRVIRSELKPVENVASDTADQPATIAAIVDSPTIASSRLFVGKATAKATSPGSAMPTLSMSEYEIGNTMSIDQAAPLRAFLRSSQGLTAV